MYFLHSTLVNVQSPPWCMVYNLKASEVRKNDSTPQTIHSRLITGSMSI